VPGAAAHFQLLGYVSAGRDVGSLRFERESLATHLRFGADALAAFGITETTIRVTLLDPAFEPVLDHVTAALADRPGVRVIPDPTRESGRGYYSGLCFKVHGLTARAGEWEIGDGGFTDWTAQLLGNRKERLLVSGYGVDRLAAAL
jgi:hypothetical protein